MNFSRRLVPNTKILRIQQAIAWTLFAAALAIMICAGDRSWSGPILGGVFLALVVNALGLFLLLSLRERRERRKMRGRSEVAPGDEAAVRNRGGVRPEPGCDAPEADRR